MFGREDDFITVLAGLVPAIHVFAWHSSTGRGCVDARTKSGQDELWSAWHTILNDREHYVE
jgi:hypothetical protein